MNKLSLRRAWRIAYIEYYKWIVNPRMCVAFSMIIFVWNFAVSPLMLLSREMESPLNFFEPFIAVLNSKALCLITPSVYLFLISDYPRLDQNSFFVICRINKFDWILGQYLFSIFSALTFLSSILLCSCIPNITNTFMANGWSLVVTRYGIYFPQDSNSFATTLITKELYNQISPNNAAFISFVMTFLYMVLIANLLLLFFVFNVKKIGISIIALVIAFGSAFGIIKSSIMWLFPMAHTMVSLHYTEYFNKPIMKIHYSVLYFLGIIFFLLILNLIFVRHTKFLSINENE